MTLNVFHSTWFFYFLKSLSMHKGRRISMLIFHLFLFPLWGFSLLCSLCIPPLLRQSCWSLCWHHLENRHLQECCYHSSTQQLHMKDTWGSSLARWKEPSLDLPEHPLHHSLIWRNEEKIIFISIKLSSWSEKTNSWHLLSLQDGTDVLNTNSIQ